MLLVAVVAVFVLPCVQPCVFFVLGILYICIFYIFSLNFVLFIYFVFEIFCFYLLQLHNSPSGINKVPTTTTFSTTK